MEHDDKPVLIYSTFPDAAAAAAAGEALVERRLAACVNILPSMTSIYNWEGRRERSQEAVMIIKTRRSLAERAIAAGRARHPYTTPAFLVIEVAGGDAAYIAWLMAETERPA